MGRVFRRLRAGGNTGTRWRGHQTGRSSRKFAAVAGGRTRVRLPHSWAHHRARKPARRDAPGKSIADPARTRFQRKGSRSSRCIEILLRQPADDAARHDWVAGENCMGMTHRGRLNVLANFLKKSLNIIFTEFTENYIPNLVAGDGDVKYHLGYRTVRKLPSGGEVEIRLSANPSHLEAVDPVVEGTARARQRIRNDTEHRRKVLPLLLHGDAAFAGQGIVAETL